MSPHVGSALEYVAMAEHANGPFAFDYIWGDALEELERAMPAARIINLETSITASDEYEPKGINYRMHPANTPTLSSLKINCCALANNHVLDWGASGLFDTLAALRQADIKPCGAGRNLAEALEPAIIELGSSRVLVFAVGTQDSGIPAHWAATEARAGVSSLPNLSRETATDLAERVRGAKRPGDLSVLSIHWGGNWGYEVSREQQNFAHALVDLGAVDIIHGHSSHHPRMIEVYKNKLILYGCGDFLDDYEGISGYEQFRPYLKLMYFVTADPTAGNLLGLSIMTLEVRRFRLQRAQSHDVIWLRDVLTREGRGLRVILEPENRLVVQWQDGATMSRVIYPQ